MWVADFLDGNDSTPTTSSTKARDLVQGLRYAVRRWQPSPTASSGQTATTMWVADNTDKQDLRLQPVDQGARLRPKTSTPWTTAGNAATLRPLVRTAPPCWQRTTTMNMTKIYSYNMPTPSDDATLSALTVNGTSVPGFNADRASYQYGVAHSASQVTVAATTTDAAATVAYSTTDADSGTDGHQLALSAGRNPVTVTVTAQDGNTTAGLHRLGEPGRQHDLRLEGV